jgi:2-dehydropantoate 2-reductase
MRIAVIGAGGVGGYFGGRLAADGNEVLFAARGAHRAAMKEQGLRIVSRLGDCHVERPFLIDDPADAGFCDVILLCTKLWDLAAAAEWARPLVARDSAVIPLQNGIEGEAVVAEVLGGENTAGGVAYIATEIAKPGVIRHTGSMATLAFGALAGNGDLAWGLEAFQAACTAAGIDAKLSSRIDELIWRKFIMLTAFAGATGLMREPIGAVLASEEGRALFTALVAETAAVARAKGIALDKDAEAKIIAQVESLPGEMKSSLLTDLERGNRLELPWLSGAVLRLGKELGVETPEHTRVVEALAPFVEGG